MNLSERPRIRALARADEFDRFISVLVFIPKDRYDTTIRQRVGEYLAGIYQGRVSAAYPSYPDGPLARTHYIVGRNEGETPHVDRETLEKRHRRNRANLGRRTAHVARGAQNRRRRARPLRRYGDAFSAAYREAFPPAEATGDIDILERLSEQNPLAVDLYRRERDPDTRVNLRLFSRGAALPLSQRVPLLENLGFRVVNDAPTGLPGGRVRGRGRLAARHDAGTRNGRADRYRATHKPVEETLLALFSNAADSDGFNRLVLEAGLPWRDVAMIRALGRYLRQIQVPYGQDIWRRRWRGTPRSPPS